MKIHLQAGATLLHGGDFNTPQPTAAVRVPTAWDISWMSLQFMAADDIEGPTRAARAIIRQDQVRN